jgi:hypothetical protein
LYQGLGEQCLSSSDCYCGLCDEAPIREGTGPIDKLKNENYFSGFHKIETSRHELNRSAANGLAQKPIIWMKLRTN